jgi:hypothetical protein
LPVAPVKQCGACPTHPDAPGAHRPSWLLPSLLSAAARVPASSSPRLRRATCWAARCGASPRAARTTSTLWTTTTGGCGWAALPVHGATSVYYLVPAEQPAGCGHTQAVGGPGPQERRSWPVIAQLPPRRVRPTTAVSVRSRALTPPCPTLRARCRQEGAPFERHDAGVSLPTPRPAHH